MNKFDDSLVSDIHKNLRDAEEKYLKAMGWKLERRTGPLHSVWSCPEFTLPYSRTQAVMVTKSTDKNFGIM
jgi:hypothetical protein